MSAVERVSPEENGKHRHDHGGRAEQDRQRQPVSSHRLECPPAQHRPLAHETGAAPTYKGLSFCSDHAVAIRGALLVEDHGIQFFLRVRQTRLGAVA